MIFRPERWVKRAAAAALAAATVVGSGVTAASSPAAGFMASARAALARGDGIAAEAELDRALDAGAARPQVAAAMGDALLLQGATDKARDWLAAGQFAAGQESYGWRTLGRLER